MKQAVERAMRFGAKGVAIQVAAGSAAPRCPAVSGSARAACPCTPCAPTSTFGQAEARTTYGVIGVKVWIYRGDVAPDGRRGQPRRRRWQRQRRAAASDRGVAGRGARSGPWPAWPASARGPGSGPASRLSAPERRAPASRAGARRYPPTPPEAPAT